jgi:hypothetical protein
MKKLILHTILIVVVSACSSSPKKKEAEYVRPKINYDEVQNQIGLDLVPGRTGFSERKFDACYLGEALENLVPRLKDCKQAYFTLVQFQISCRQDEQPTAHLTDSDLQVLSNQQLKWTMGSTLGELKSDFGGNGFIQTITSSSQKRSYLRISTGFDFLVMRANDATSIVAPPSWCVAR